MALTKYEKMAYMRGPVDHWIAKGLGSGQAYNEYLGIRERIGEKARMRKTDFLSVYREWQGEVRKRSAFKSLRRDLTPKETMVERLFVYPKYRYTYEGRIQLRDAQTGEIEERFYRIGYDELKTKSVVEADVLGLWDRVDYVDEIVSLGLDRIIGTILR
jgi:hypothetical protein